MKKGKKRGKCSPESVRMIFSFRAKKKNFLILFIVCCFRCIRELFWKRKTRKKNEVVIVVWCLIWFLLTTKSIRSFSENRIKAFVPIGLIFFGILFNYFFVVYVAGKSAKNGDGKCINKMSKRSKTWEKELFKACKRRETIECHTK